MPRLIYFLALAVFAMGTSEFMLAGVLPAIADDFSIPTEQAGTLVSGYALGMAVAAPACAALTRRWPQRATLIGLLLIFGVAHIAAAVTPDFTMLLGTRVIAAAANAGFLATALAAAVSAVPENRRARAVATLLAGTTTAMVAGVPAGTLLGSAVGWRSTFWAVALACVPPLVAIARSSRSAGSAITTSEELPLGRELRALARPSIIGLLVVSALVNAGTFGTLTYLAVMTTDSAGLPGGWVALVLVVFGAGAFAGVTLAGRFAGSQPRRLLHWSMPSLLVAWIALALCASVPAAFTTIAGIAGLLAFAVGGTMVTLITTAADDAPTMRGAYATVALNVGAIIGPVAAGATLGALGPLGPAWFAAGATLLAGLGTLLLAGRIPSQTEMTDGADGEVRIR